MKSTGTPAAVHHVELWTSDLAGAFPSWDWLLTTMGWVRDDGEWEPGRIWTHADGTYLVLEQSPALVSGDYDRMRAGLNHVALNCADSALLERLRSGATRAGWAEMFEDVYPHAGGPDHTALFLENDEGFEVEIVLAPRPHSLVE